MAKVKMFSSSAFKKSMLSSFYLGVTLVSAQAQSGFAWGFRVLASGGYENLQVEDGDYRTVGVKEKGPVLTGGNIALTGQAELLDIVPTVHVVGGVALKKSFLSKTTTAENSDATLKLYPQFIGAEAGLQIGLIPLITVQAVAGYDYGLGGATELTVNVKSSGGGSVNSKGAIDRQSQFHLTGRALLTVLPLVSGGLEASWQSGKIGIKDTDSGTVGAESKYTGYSLNAVISVSI